MTQYSVRNRSNGYILPRRVKHCVKHCVATLTRTDTHTYIICNRGQKKVYRESHGIGTGYISNLLGDMKELQGKKLNGIRKAVFVRLHFFL